MVNYRYGGWDGKKWLSDVFVLDTSKDFAFEIYNFSCSYVLLMWFFIFILFIVYAFKQCHWSGPSWRLQEHCHHQGVVIQPLWLRSGCLYMVEEVSYNYILRKGIIVNFHSVSLFFSNMFFKNNINSFFSTQMHK